MLHQHGYRSSIMIRTESCSQSATSSIVCKTCKILNVREQAGGVGSVVLLFVLPSRLHTNIHCMSSGKVSGTCVCFRLQVFILISVYSVSSVRTRACEPFQCTVLRDPCSHSLVPRNCTLSCSVFSFCCRPHTRTRVQ